MAAAESSAHAIWEGGLEKGGGTVELESGATEALPVSWASRTSRSAGKTSPEELIAAAHSSCYCMALSHGLGEAGTPPERLEVAARVGFVPGEGITGVKLSVEGTVPGIEEQAFLAAAEEAKEGCPVSQALSVQIDLEAKLV